MIPRYTRKEMGEIWEPENRFRKWLDIEIYEKVSNKIA